MNPSIHFSHFFSAVLLFPSVPPGEFSCENRFPDDARHGNIPLPSCFCQQKSSRRSSFTDYFFPSRFERIASIVFIGHIGPHMVQVFSSSGRLLSR